MARIDLSNIGGGGILTLTTTGTTGASTYAAGILNIPVYQGALTLTTTGTSGAATLVGDTLNIPNYATGGSPAGSAGEVQFNSTPAGSFAASSNLAWDNTNVRLNIGAPSSPTGRLNVKGSGATSSTVNIRLTNSSNNELFNVLDNGNTGIGVVSPSVPLEIKGTTITDGGQLGAELLSSSNWTTTGWTGDWVNGFSHTTGNTSALSNTLTASVTTYYQITYTITNRTAGTFEIAFGGQSLSGLSATGGFGPRATTTGNLTITPTTDFDGTVVISIKIVAQGTATVRLQNSAGAITNEVRSFTSNSNTAVGISAGSRVTTGVSNSFFGISAGSNNTTGGANNFFGATAGQANTTGGANNFFGTAAGQTNTTGSSNSYFGTSAGRYNTTGGNNSFFGTNAGLYTSSGSNLTSSYNSVFIGFDTRAAANSEPNQTVIGYQAIGLGSNTTVIGNSSTTLTWLGGSTSIGTTASSARLHVRGANTTTGVGAFLVQNSTPSDLYKIENDGKITYWATNTAAGTTGAQTINRPSGTVNFAAGTSSLVVTNSLCTTSSIVLPVVRTNDATATIKNVVPGAGSFTINLGAAATAETSVGFFIIN